MERPLQLEILRMLLEAGEENLPAILNTLLVRRPDAAAPGALLADVSDALDAIERQSYAELARYKDGWIALTPEDRQLVLPLAQSVEWHPATGRWRWKQDMAQPDRPVLLLTGKGRDYISRVLRAEPRGD